MNAKSSSITAHLMFCRHLLILLIVRIITGIHSGIANSDVPNTAETSIVSFDPPRTSYRASSPAQTTTLLFQTPLDFKAAQWSLYLPYERVYSNHFSGFFFYLYISPGLYSHIDYLWSNKQTIVTDLEVVYGHRLSLGMYIQHRFHFKFPRLIGREQGIEYSRLST